MIVALWREIMPANLPLLQLRGLGEEIVDDAVAARMETRIRDGLSLKESSHKTYTDAKKLKRSYGWIGIDKFGYFTASYTKH